MPLHPLSPLEGALGVKKRLYAPLRVMQTYILDKDVEDVGTPLLT